MTRKMFKTMLEAIGIYVDAESGYRLLARKDGCFEVKEMYFYHCGKTAQLLAERLITMLPAGKFEIVETRDEWRPWPKDSFMVAVLRPVE